MRRTGLRALRALVNSLRRVAATLPDGRREEEGVEASRMRATKPATLWKFLGRSKLGFLE